MDFIPGLVKDADQEDGDCSLARSHGCRNSGLADEEGLHSDRELGNWLDVCHVDAESMLRSNSTYYGESKHQKLQKTSVARRNMAGEKQDAPK